MDLIVETDIGHDPDDFAAICWLVSAGVRIRAILISPGDEDQVAVAKFLLHEVGCTAPVGVSHLVRGSYSATAFHQTLLTQHRWPLKMPPDGLGTDILRDVLRTDPGIPCFACGPMDSLGAFLKTGGHIASVTIQGGFAPYSLYAPTVRVAKFDGQHEVSSFNLNGNPEAACQAFSAPGVIRRLVGKNVCHTVFYGRSEHDKIMAISPRNPAMALFRSAMSLYLTRHNDKKFHDPVAAVCHVHPEIGTWIRGRPYKENGKWGTHPDPAGDHILVDLDRDAFWQHVESGE
jgi:inosine-uridine nucleoside N-ribohydrolase